MTLQALWQDRWPTIALPECVARVDAAAPDARHQVRMGLPCDQGGPNPEPGVDDCPAAGRCLTAKRKAMGSLLFDRENLTRPRSSASSMFPRELWEPCLDRHDDLVPHYNKPFGHSMRLGVASAWDVAWSERTGGDYVVKMTGVIDRETGKRRIVDILRVKGLTFAQQKELTVAEWRKYHDDVVVVESNAAQVLYAQELERTPVPVLRHPMQKKGDLEKGIPRLVVQLEARKWELPYRDGGFHHEHAEVFLAECEAFGWNNGKLEGVGEHDDTVAAWHHLAWALDRLVAPETPGRARSPQASAAYI